MSAATVLAHVPSSSNPSVAYEIRLGGDGNVYCTCPAWKFQKLPPKERSCKHMKELSGQIAKTLGKLKMAPVAAAPKAEPKKAPKAAPAKPVATPAPVAVVAPPAPAAPPVLVAVPSTGTDEKKLALMKAARAKVEVAKAALALARAEAELADAEAAAVS